MQWIFMLVGLVLGTLAGESLGAALLGGLLGLSLGQAFRLQALARQNAELAAQLEGFAERFERGTTAIHERLLRVEQAQAAAPGAEAEPVAAAEPVPPEPDWTLDIEPQAAEIGPAPAEADAAASQGAAMATDGDAGWARPARGPSVFQRALAKAKAWLLGGNTLLRVGVLLLFLGLAFLLRYATEGLVLPVELRYAGVAASAIALLGLGWWLRWRNPGYALVLQGAGVGVLYLTVFAAMRLHPLLPAGLALALLVLVTCSSAILAVAQNALGLAAAAALGGFAAPILTSTGSGDHVALFGYFALLNAGILTIAWFKAWRLLNLIGFVGTFSIGLAWGLRAYTPELLWSTAPFLWLFFLMYLAIGLLFARRKLREAAQAPSGRGELLRWSAGQGDYLDATVLLGPPLVGFGLQFALVQHLEFAAAFSALGLGLLYLSLARLLAGRTAGRALLLVETCLALGVVFASLAIPLGLDARWTSAAWAVEGAGVYWLALHQRRGLARAFALLLQFGAALAYLGELRVGVQSLLDGAVLGALLLGVALSFSYWQLRQAPAEASSTWERRGSSLLAGAGLAFLYLMAPLSFAVAGSVIAWAVAGLLTLLLGLRLQARVLLLAACAVQLLGGLLLLLQLGGVPGLGVEAGGGLLLSAALLAALLVAGLFWAVRLTRLGIDRRVLFGGAALLLLALGSFQLMQPYVLPGSGAVWGAAALLVLGFSQQLQRRVGFALALALQFASGLALLIAGRLLLDQGGGDGLWPLAHAEFWAPAALALVALLAAWRLQVRGRGEAPARLDGLGLPLAPVLLVWGVAWLGLALAGELLRFVEGSGLQSAALLLAAALSALLAGMLAQRRQWPELALLGGLLLPVAAVVLLQAWHWRYQPSAHFGWLAWPALFAAHFWLLRRLAPLLPAGARSASHVLGCWLLLAVIALELRYRFLALAEHYNAWRWLGWALLPSAYLWLMARPRRRPWPLADYPREYRVLAALPLALLMLAWFWLANVLSAGEAAPLPYLPLLNPLELGLLLSLAALYAWASMSLPELGLTAARSRLLLKLLVGASLFALFTALVMRTAHHWGGVPYRLQPLLDSMLVQAGLSIVWTLIALPLMVFGHLRRRRELWLVGAALIAVVVAKLFFVELGNRGGLERIVSFIGVGVLLLVVGYFAPLPPARQDRVRPLEEERV
ncbi:DUF2339 domain-containing protein [Pseudomonas benzenivorans]|uniref:DUF2339 domain-containing protein n=1 Tax=Pseudomonas benzenivorans TaxID=556533 RepID=A0ABZ0PXA8_9PSED|nr:DUF2339 domain-containing protein [Pseudomonas benzenivorans]WPC05524.1 DUF2339 domain-containing protein [Pseudomonas benzenivorans]